ncbi:MAG TPA: hypothetical protein VF945_04280 [Polyangia bacterium]
MNRKLGHWIKAALFALPLALPGVALAQSATDTSSPSAQTPQAPQDTSNKGSLEETNKETTGGSFDRADKQNAGSVDQTTPSQTTPSEIDRTPPAGALDKSGPSTSSDRSIGGDINKSDDTMNMNSESTTTTTTKQKKSKKIDKSAPSKDTSSDMNR